MQCHHCSETTQTHFSNVNWHQYDQNYSSGAICRSAPFALAAEAATWPCAPAGSTPMCPVKPAGVGTKTALDIADQQTQIKVI